MVNIIINLISAAFGIRCKIKLIKIELIKIKSTYLTSNTPHTRQPVSNFEHPQRQSQSLLQTEHDKQTLFLLKIKCHYVAQCSAIRREVQRGIIKNFKFHSQKQCIIIKHVL